MIKLEAADFGGVYYVGSMAPGGATVIKIGFSATSIARRIKSLQTANPWPLVLLACVRGASREFEQTSHYRFQHLHIDGEWFRYGDDLIEHINFLSREP